MSESSAWATLRQSLIAEASAREKSIHIVRVENTVALGTLDSNIAFAGREIWLEGKYLDAFPKRKKTLVKVGLRDEQETFAIRRLYTGSFSYLWLKVGDPQNSDYGYAWHLIRLDSLELIRSLRTGISQEILQGFQYVSSKSLASSLLNQLEYS